MIEVETGNILKSYVRDVPENGSAPGGYVMSVAMTNCGAAGWITDRTGRAVAMSRPLRICKLALTRINTVFLAINTVGVDINASSGPDIAPLMAAAASIFDKSPVDNEGFVMLI